MRNQNKFFQSIILTQLYGMLSIMRIDQNYDEDNEVLLSAAEFYVCFFCIRLR